jgi:magnesium transporter
MKKLLLMGKKKKIGLPPGSIIHIGENSNSDTKIEVIEYNESHLKESEYFNDEFLFKDEFEEKSDVSWIDVSGVHNEKIIEEIGEGFAAHPLILEDIVNTGQRPKIDLYNDYIFISLKVLAYNNEKDEVEFEQISLILGKNFIITFQKEDKDFFSLIKDRIRNTKGIVREKGADYLAYALIDSIVDNYYLTLEILADKVEELEKDIISNPSSDELERIKHYKNEITFIRKSIWPLRDIIRSIIRSSSSLIKESTEIYFKDIYDHVVEILDMIGLLQDMLTNTLDVYLTSSSNKMNEIMKILTIISSIFIPLTFITGVYGMNFKYMPELESNYGYPIVLSLMFVIIILLLMYFKRKDWL